MSINTIFIGKVSDILEVPDYFSLGDLVEETEIELVLAQTLGLYVRDFFFPTLAALTTLGAKVYLVDGYHPAIGEKIKRTIETMVNNMGLEFPEHGFIYHHKNTEVERGNTLTAIKEKNAGTEVVNLGQVKLRDYIAEKLPNLFSKSLQEERRFKAYKESQGRPVDVDDKPVIDIEGYDN